MSNQVKSLGNKENIPLRSSTISHNDQASLVKKLQDEIIRLEKLYADQSSKTHQSHTELEKLELDLLQKDRVILQQQSSSKKINELNKSLSKKLSTEISYYETQLERYKKLDKEWQFKWTKLKIENQKYEKLTKMKNEEIYQLNQDVDRLLNDLDSKNNEIERLNQLLEERVTDSLDGYSTKDSFLQTPDFSTSTHSKRHTFDSDEDGYDDDIIENDQLIDDEEDIDETEISVNNEEYNSSLNLSSELNDEILEKNRQIKQQEFELISLRKEKAQLYTYINRLLRNKPDPNQNDILKRKLVTRRILRAASVNVKHDQLKPKKGQELNTFKNRRVFSSFVTLKNSKSYNHTMSPISQNSNNNNSDDERDEFNEDISIDKFELLLLGYSIGHKVLPKIYTKSFNASKLLVITTGSRSENNKADFVDLDLVD